MEDCCADDHGGSERIVFRYLTSKVYDYETVCRYFAFSVYIAAVFSAVHESQATKNSRRRKHENISFRRVPAKHLKSLASAFSMLLATHFATLNRFGGQLKRQYIYFYDRPVVTFCLNGWART